MRKGIALLMVCTIMLVGFIALVPAGGALAAAEPITRIDQCGPNNADGSTYVLTKDTLQVDLNKGQIRTYVNFQSCGVFQDPWAWYESPGNSERNNVRINVYVTLTNIDTGKEYRTKEMSLSKDYLDIYVPVNTVDDANNIIGVNVCIDSKYDAGANGAPVTGRYNMKVTWVDHTGADTGTTYVVNSSKILNIVGKSGSGGTTQPATKEGWNQADGNWYYVQNGQRVSGWKQIGAKWYLFDDRGKMLTGWQKTGGARYYLNPSGSMATGWNKCGTSMWYYLHSNGKMATGWQQIGGVWYWFAPSGYMAMGWKYIGDHRYFFEASGRMKTGWMEHNGNWWYFKSNGTMAANETLTIDGKSYRFDEGGVWVV